MLESAKEIHGHANKQLTNHSSATEQEIAKEYKWFLSSNLVARLIKSRATRDVRQTGNFVEQQQSRVTKLLDFVACLTSA